MQRIAALTDEAERAQQRAADAERRLALTEIALVEASDRVAAMAVDAFVDTAESSERTQLRRRMWTSIVSRIDRRAASDFRAAKEAAEKERARADAAAADARRVAAELDAARAALERTIAERARKERPSSSRRAVVPSNVSSHRRATSEQLRQLRTGVFGPTDGVPDGLRATGQVIAGRASWYGPGFDGRPTASGAIFDQEAWTVAHRTLPLGTILLITHGDRSLVALVNDRGPFVGGRVLDLSHGCARYLGTVQAGVAPVRAEVLVPA